MYKEKKLVYIEKVLKCYPYLVDGQIRVFEVRGWLCRNIFQNIFQLLVEIMINVLFAG